MNKFYLLLLVSLLFVTGCSKKEDKPVDNKNLYNVDSSDIKTKPVDNPNESFTLFYNYEKGTKYSYKLSSISIDDQEMKAGTVIKQSVKQNIIYLLELTPTQKDQDGTLELDVTINKVKLDAQANGQNFSFESGSVKDSANRVQYAEYEALAKNTFSVRVSKKGEILDIFRADKISNRYIQLKGYSDSLNAEQKNMVRTNMIQGALRPILIQLFRQVPDHNIAKDSTWTLVQPASQFMSFSLQNTNLFKIQNLEQFNDDKVAVIDAGLSTVVTGNTKVTDRGVSYNFTKPVTHADGKIYYNISKGYIIKSKTQTKVNIFYTMEAPTPKGKQKGERKETIQNINIVEML